MQKILTHLWFDTEAKEATAFYTTLFKDSKVTTLKSLHDTPSGDSDIVGFTLAGQEFMAISAGPYFRFNPSISLFVVFDDEAEIDATWDALAEGGKVLMEYQKYPWADKYGWLQDKYGLSWQLSMSENHKLKQKITPLLMFTKEGAGKAKEAIDLYTTIFPDSSIEMMVPYEKGEGDQEGFIKHARFTLAGIDFMAMDSSGPHEFVFNEAISFLVRCETQEEIDRYSDALSAVPASEQCGWIKDKYGVSWQISSTAMEKMMSEGTPEQVQRVTDAFLKMKRLDIAALEAAYERK